MTPDCPYILTAPEPARPLLRACLAYLGMRETDVPNAVPGLTEDNPRPWCAALASRVLRDCGVPVAGSDSARELLRQLGEAGFSVAHDGDLLPGDVVGWRRVDAAGGIIGAHVGIVLAVADDGIDVWAGNSGPHSRRVAITVVPAERVEWAARPMR